MGVRSICILSLLCACGDGEPRDSVAHEGSSSDDDGGTTGAATSMSSPTSTGDATQSGSASMTSSSSTASGTDGASASDSDGPADTGDGGSTEGGLPAGCYDYDAFEPTAVSFRADVMPIFATACSSCHTDPTASIYFGQGGTTEPEAAAIYAKLLEGESKQAPHLAFVAPGDPLHSYMLAKIEYPDPGGTCAAVQCDEPGCELPAPPAGPLSDQDKGVLRSWVMNGAADD